MSERDIDIGHGDLEAFCRSGMGSLEEFLTMPESLRAAVIVANEAVVEERACRLALFIAGAMSGAHDEIAARIDPGAPEEAANLQALNNALAGGARV